MYLRIMRQRHLHGRILRAYEQEMTCVSSSSEQAVETAELCGDHHVPGRDLMGAVLTGLARWGQQAGHEPALNRSQQLGQDSQCKSIRICNSLQDSSIEPSAISSQSASYVKPRVVARGLCQHFTSHVFHIFNTYNISRLLFLTSSTAQGGGGSFRIGNL